MKKITIGFISLITILCCLVFYTNSSFSQESEGFDSVATLFLKNGEKIQLSDFKIFSHFRQHKILDSESWLEIDGWPIQLGNLWQMIPLQNIQQIDKGSQVDSVILTDGRELKGNALQFSVSKTWFARDANLLHLFGKTKVLGSSARFKARLATLKTIKKSNNPTFYEITDTEGAIYLVEALSLKKQITTSWSRQVFTYPGKLKVKIKDTEVQLMMKDIEYIGFPSTDTFDPNSFSYDLHMKDGNELKVSLGVDLKYGFGKTKSGQIWYGRLWDFAPGSHTSARSVSNIKSIKFE
jgi:hypothetical protein